MDALRFSVRVNDEVGYLNSSEDMSSLCGMRPQLEAAAGEVD